MVEPTKAEVLEAARRYVHAGLSVMPIRERKKPVLAEWGPYQSQRATDEKLQEWFGNGARRGIAVICGKVSGNIEVLDIEGRFAHMLDTIADEIDQQSPGLWERLPLIKTPSGGWHVPYRCEQIGGSKKLARRLVEVPEGTPGAMLRDGKWTKIECLIEVKAEGGYVVTYPSPALCHPDGGHYESIAGDWLDLPTITADQREMVHTVSKSFNELIEPAYEPHSHAKSEITGTRPGDDFNMRASWEQVLEPHGWARARQRGNVTLWRKPGSSDPYHASTNYAGSDLFYCFSTATEFQEERGYSKFAAYAILNQAGNFEAAARDLASQGYGEQRQYSAGSYTRADGEPNATSGQTIDEPGMVNRMLAQSGQDVRFCHRWQQWFCWDGRHWAEDDGDTVFRMCSAAVNSFISDASREPDPERQRAILAKCKQFTYARAKRGILDSLKNERSIVIKPDDLDKNQFLFNSANGTIDLRTGELRPHNRADLITKLSPVSFDPNATAPRFLSFISELMASNESLVSFLQKAAGYSLTGSVSEQCFFLLHGSGANGKSTLMNLLGEMSGQYAAVAQAESLMVSRNDQIPTDIARLKGARFVAASETESGRRLAEAKIKQLTGGDRITARHLYSKEFEFVPQFKVWLSANHKPTVRGNDEGIWRRVRLIPFTVSFPEEKQDKQLLDKLREESPGILAWAVQGCLDWLQHGLEQPEAVKSATGNYRNEMDTVASFIDEKCIVGPDYCVASSAIYAAFKAWAEANNEFLISGTAFSLRLQERFERQRTRRGSQFVGIGLFEV